MVGSGGVVTRAVDVVARTEAPGGGSGRPAVRDLQTAERDGGPRRTRPHGGAAEATAGRVRREPAAPASALRTTDAQFHVRTKLAGQTFNKTLNKFKATHLTSFTNVFYDEFQLTRIMQLNNS